MYWCVVTMTSVGYGDYFPVTIEGRAIACLTMFFGVICIAMPVIIVGREFANAKHALDFSNGECLADSAIWEKLQDLNKIINMVIQGSYFWKISGFSFRL